MMAAKPVCALLLLWTACLCTFASPAFKHKKAVRQPDGTLLTIIKGGDETGFFYKTEDGIRVAKGASGGFYYATINNAGVTVAGRYMAHAAQQRSLTEAIEAETCKRLWEDFLQRENKILQRAGLGTIANASIKPMGTPLIPVVLVNFADKKIGSNGYVHSNEEAVAFYRRHFNEENYNEGKYFGSVRDYFICQSDSLFRPKFEILGPITLEHSSSYYGRNKGGFDMGATEMMNEAIRKLTEGGTNFSAYSTTGNNVPLIAFIYAGDGEHATGESDDVIACYYPLFSTHIGENTFQTALCVNETADYDGTGQQPDGIGTFCHEFSHAMGLPDFYNTNGLSGIFGLDAWDIMDYGQYVGLGHRPTGYSAYEREFMGWLRIDTLTTKKQMVTLTPLASQKAKQTRAYKILNEQDATGNEYYILENRQASAWFDEDYGKGMLVYHIDYDVRAWTGNAVNNSRRHQRMTIIPADGILTPSYDTDNLKTFQGDTYPGLTDNTELSDNSMPCDTAYTGNYMNRLLAGIREDENGNISFAYMAKGKLATPEKPSFEYESPTSLKISWEHVAYAENYVIKVEENGIRLPADTVKDASYRLTGIHPDSKYAINIQATADDYIASEWQDIRIEATPSKTAGTVIDKATTAEIWTANGFYLGRKMPSNLKKGIYIIRKGAERRRIFIP